MKRSLLSIAMLLALPSFASAAFNCWSVTRGVMPAERAVTLQQPADDAVLGIKTVGNITYVQAATGQACATAPTELTFTLTPPVGNIAPVVKVDGLTQAVPTVGVANTYTVAKGTKISHNIQATYAATATKVSITTIGATGGYIEASKKIDYNGDTTVRITPAAGYTVASVSVNGTATAAYLADVVADNLLSLDDVTAANTTVTATFAQTLTLGVKIDTANATLVPDQVLNLKGTALVNSSNIVPTYAWSVSPATDVTLGTPNAANATFAAAKTGTYTVTLTVADAAKNLIASDTRIIKVEVANVCASCHTVRDAGLSTAYAASTHANNPYHIVGCADCHNPAADANHPFALDLAVSACAPCHAPYPPTAHATVEGACVTCHNPHSLKPVASTIADTHAGGTKQVKAQYVAQNVTCANCHAGNNAEELAAWAKSGHGNVAGDPWYHYDWAGGGSYTACQRCHTTTGYVNNLTGSTTAMVAGQAAQVLTCAGCHADTATGALRAAGAFTLTTGTNAQTVAFPDVAASNLCVRCHAGRETGASIAADPSTTGTRSFINSHYLDAAGSIFGNGGYEYAGQTYAVGFHASVGVNNTKGTGNDGPCVTCHMTSAEGHTFEAVTAAGAPASSQCALCHDGLDAAALAEAKSSFETALHELQAALDKKGIYYYPAHPYFYKDADANGVFNVGEDTNRNGKLDAGEDTDADGVLDLGFDVASATKVAFTEWEAAVVVTDHSGNAVKDWKQTMGAAFNYNLLHHDPGAYAHNRQYALKLIYDSIDFLADGSVNGAGVFGASNLLEEAKVAAEAANHVAFAANSCVTCHSDNNAALPDASLASAHAYTNNFALSNVQAAAAANGTDLVITYNLKVDGANAAGFTTVQRDYRFDGARNDAGVVTAAVDNGDGNYTVTIPAASLAIDSRYLLRVANAAGTQVIVTVDYPATPAAANVIASDAACVDCHGTKTAGFHYSNPVGVKQCVVCHEATNTTYPRLTPLIHGIHNSHNMPSGKFVLAPGEEFSVTYPTYMNNCSVCHRGADLTTVNDSAISFNQCMTCHENWSGFDHGNTVFGTTDHATFDAATTCGTCHSADSAASMHNGLLTERSGLIWNGQDFSVTEGAKTIATINEVSRVDNNLVIKWTATYDGVATDPCFGPSTAADPRPSWKNGTGAFSILRAWADKDDWTNAGIGTSPGQPISTNIDWTGAVSATKAGTVCADNVATTTVMLTAAELAKPAGSKLGVALQGKPSIYNANISATTTVRGPSAIKGVSFAAAAAEPATPVVLAVNDRRQVVDTAACLKCHVGSFYQHGGNRVDNVDFCVMCHNEASSEQNVRIADGVDATEAYDGKPGQTYGFKSLLHAVHSAGENEAITMCYRTNGNYVWAGHNTVIPNYPTADVFGDDALFNPIYWVNDDATKTQTVGSGVAALIYGSSSATGTGPQTEGTVGPPTFSGTVGNANYNPAYPAGTTAPAGAKYQMYRAHNLHHTTYPQALNNCMACHKPGTFGFPDATKAVGTTINTGAGTTWNDLTNDTVQGPSAAACFSCHQGEMKPAPNHGNVGGFAPAVFGARTAVPAESCASCHN